VGVVGLAENKANSAPIELELELELSLAIIMDGQKKRLIGAQAFILQYNPNLN